MIRGSTQSTESVGSSQPRRTSLLLAQNAAEESNEPSSQKEEEDELPAAGELLQQSRTALGERRSIRAQIRETVTIGDRKFTAAGTYLQGSGLKLRLEFNVKTGQTEGSVLEVCDGQVLWSSHSVGKEERVSRRDVDKILKAATQSRNLPQGRLLAELGLGGLRGLLAALERSMDFEYYEDEALAGKPIVIVQGTWNRTARRRWTRAQARPDTPLPIYIPDSVRIYFHRATLFPQRIVYRKVQSPRKFDRPMLTLQFDNVVFDSPVNEQDFTFVTPPNVIEDDLTDFYLQQLQTGSVSSSRPPQRSFAPGR